MESSINQTFAPAISHAKSSKILLEIPIYIYMSVIASMCVIAGVIWDIAWHMSIGRDGLFSAPHVVTYVGAAGAGLFSGFQVLKTSFWGKPDEKGKMINFWGIFYGSLGALFCIWGGIASLTSAPFDDWWHNTYGLDVKILSPPHTILLLGLLSVQMGAMIGVLAFLNNSDLTSTLTNSEKLTRKKRLQWMFIFTAAFFVASVFTFLSEELGRWMLHNPLFYQVASAAFPFILIAAGRASDMKWGITYLTIIFMVFFWLITAVLRALPAEPLLGPIHHQISTYQTLGFPILLFIPAFFIDILREKFSTKNDWILAVILGVIFTLTMLISHYPWGNFIHESPLARNWFWGSDTWSFQNDSNFEYRFKYGPWNNKTAFEWITGIFIAIFISIFSTKIGLTWGNWMKKVRR